MPLQLSKNEEVDQVLQQQLMDQLRRANENIAYELGVQRDRQETDLNAKLNARRERKKVEARRLAQEDAAKRLLAEQEKQREKLNEGKLVEGLQKSLSPADMADLTIEEQVTFNWEVLHSGHRVWVCLNFLVQKNLG